MNAQKRLRAAAGLQVIAGIAGVFSAVRILAAGSEGLPPPAGAEAMGGPPFWAGLMFFALAVASLFSAYGLWSGQRWGKVVALVTCAVNAVFGAGDLVGGILLGDAAMTTVFAAAVAGYVTVIALVLWREAAPAAA
ncbi:hypothetical protein DCC79_03350 [bacterium]|nr:MAG: hypothetical protein DCC79_03350 [bacterium]